MTLSLLRKLLASIAVITTFYLVFLGLLYRDLTRSINRSIRHIIPGLLMIFGGIIISRLLMDPNQIRNILLIKSGFINKALKQIMLPYIASSVSLITMTGGQIAIMDKLLYIWRGKRLPYLITFITTIFIASIAGTALFVIIGEAQKTILESTQNIEQLYTILTTMLTPLTALLVAINCAKYVWERVKSR